MIKLDRLLRYALYSNAIYVFLLFLLKPNGITFEKLFVSSFLVLAVFGVYMHAYVKRKQLDLIPKAAKRIFYLLLLWSVVVVVRSFSTSLQDWVTNFGNVYMALAWFTPVIMISGTEPKNLRALFSSIFVAFLLMIAALIFLPFHIGAGKLEAEWIWLLRPVNFLLLIGVKRFDPAYRFLIYIALVVYVIIIVLTEQRIDFLFLGIVFLFQFVNQMRQIKLKKQFFKIAITTLTLLTLVIFTFGYEKFSGAVNTVIEYKDSRTFVYNELFDDLSVNEQRFGKGSLGTYYSDFFERTRRYYIISGKRGWAADVPDRITTEVGYLQMILKGGFVLMILNFLLMIYTSYLGLFKSNNKITKRLALYVLILSILSLISFRPAFTPTFIILWMSIGFVLNKNNRSLNDEEIEKRIRLK